MMSTDGINAYKDKLYAEVIKLVEGSVDKSEESCSSYCNCSCTCSHNYGHPLVYPDNSAVTWNSYPVPLL